MCVEVRRGKMWGILKSELKCVLLLFKKVYSIYLQFVSNGLLLVC